MWDYIYIAVHITCTTRAGVRCVTKRCASGLRYNFIIMMRGCIYIVIHIAISALAGVGGVAEASTGGLGYRFHIVVRMLVVARGKTKGKRSASKNCGKNFK